MNSTAKVIALVSFLYDDASNRTKMTDGLGYIDYAYNHLSQMTSETRYFSDNLPNKPMSGNFKLTYTYTLGGQLKSLKDPYEYQFNYDYDETGRLSSVQGATPFAGIAHYAASAQYRAWGGLKSLSYGNSTQMQMNYNNRLQASSYEFKKNGQSPVMSKTYDYYADGQLRKLDDAVDDKFDRLNTYDNLGRPKTAKSGLEARGGTVAQQDMQTQLPYRQSYQFNAFNNLTERNNLHWGVDYWGGQSNNLSYQYQNNRIVDQYNGRQYDAEGRLLSSTYSEDAGTYTYDAKGQMIQMQTAETDIHRTQDGDGREARRRKLNLVNGSWVEQEKIYYIRSTVLGGAVITEADANGRKKKTFVKAAGATIAEQHVFHNDGNNTDAETLIFEQMDASGLSYRATMGADGSAITGEGADGSPAEMDLMGGNVGLSSPYYEINPNPPAEEFPGQRLLTDEQPMYVNGQQVRAYMDGIEVPFSLALSSLANGSAMIDWRFTDRSVLGQMGIFPVWIPDSGRTPGGTPPDTPNGFVPDDAPININQQGDGGRWEYYFSNVSWSPQRQANTNTAPDITMNNCERQLARTFTDRDDMNFSDVLDGESRDPINYPLIPGPYPNPTGETHNHINNPTSDPMRETNVYAPAGGTVIWKEVVNNKTQNMIQVYYPKFGDQKDVVLQIVHVEKYASETLQGFKPGKDGRILLGTMGKNGLMQYKGEGYGVDGKYPQYPGLHIHINALKVWWDIRKFGVKGINRQATLDYASRKNVGLSALCK